MRRIAPLLAALAMMVVSVAGCAAAGPEHPAAVVIQELLELRRDDIRDAAAYEPYFADPELAAALAEGSDEPTGTPRVPGWRTPYVSAEESGTAEVAVVWRADEDTFPEWPAVTVFTLRLSGDRWIVEDAAEATSAPEPLGAGE